MKEISVFILPPHPYIRFFFGLREAVWRNQTENTHTHTHTQNTRLARRLPYFTLPYHDKTNNIINFQNILSDNFVIILCLYRFFTIEKRGLETRRYYLMKVIESHLEKGILLTYLCYYYFPAVYQFSLQQIQTSLWMTTYHHYALIL